MTPVNTAIWYIESHMRDQISLSSVAEAAGVSRFHLARAFAAATGHSVMGYTRARRMAEAAKTLKAGAPDILSVALSFGYNSHEAFTRAFRETFGVTPAEFRAHPKTNSPNLQEPIQMSGNLLDDLDNPRFEEGSELLITGLAATYKGEESAAGIPAQWQRFVPHMGHIPGQTSGVTYGVCAMEEDSMTYICGVETSASDEIPDGLTRMTLAAQRYAVFRHMGHVSNIRQTWATIFEKWLPGADVTRANAPDFEWYSADFDPIANTGQIEIWIPVDR